MTPPKRKRPVRPWTVWEWTAAGWVEQVTTAELALAMHKIAKLRSEGAAAVIRLAENGPPPPPKE